jgi:hypothetical protein
MFPSPLLAGLVFFFRKIGTRALRGPWFMATLFEGLDACQARISGMAAIAIVVPLI